MNSTKQVFSAETDMSYEHYRERILNALGDATPQPIQLVYRVSGDGGGYSALTTEDDFEPAMEKVVARARVARSKAVVVEVKNLVSHNYQMNMYDRVLTMELVSTPDQSGSSHVKVSVEAAARG